MKKLRNMFLTLTIFFVSIVSVYASDVRVSVGAGSDDFNMGVGNYDHFPYRSGNNGNSVQFRTVLSEYGDWVSDSNFGQVWRPYASDDWRPYTNGHWVTTQSGQTWQGYEPWSWAADHYGHWIHTRNHGWVWVPGNTYSPGRVAWSYGQDSIGWTPAPPNGYDYSQGYLGYRGANNQYSFNDNAFGINFQFGRQDNRYQPLFYNSAYQNVAPSLWVFVGRDRFLNDNYGGSYYSNVRVRDLFNRRSLYISGRPLSRDHLQRIIGRQVQVVPVRYRDITIGRQRTRYAIPVGAEDNLRRHSRVVVDRDVAPGFAKRNKKFVLKNVGNKNKQKIQVVRDERGKENKSQKVHVMNNERENKNKRQTVNVVRDERENENKHQKVDVVKVKSGEKEKAHVKKAAKKNKKAINGKGKSSKEKDKKHSDR